MARDDRGNSAAGEDRDPDIVTAEELTARLGLRSVQTTRDLLAAGVLPGQQVGRWLSSWTAVYTWIAGPGIPAGEVLSARQLATRLGIPVSAVQRAAGPPGTPGKLPGRQVGKQWRFALEAVRAALAQPTRSAGPGPQRNSPAEASEAAAPPAG